MGQQCLVLVHLHVEAEPEERALQVLDERLRRWRTAWVRQFGERAME